MQQFSVLIHRPTRRKRAVSIMKVMERQRKHLRIVLYLGGSRCFARLRNESQVTRCHNFSIGIASA